MFLSSLIAWKDAAHARSYYILSCIASFSLFPLLYRDTETPIKLLLAAVYALAALPILNTLLQGAKQGPVEFRSWEKLYLLGLPLFYIISGLLHLFPLRNGDFLPLMMVSVYSAVGTVGVWIQLNWTFLSGTRAVHSKKAN